MGVKLCSGTDIQRKTLCPQTMLSQRTADCDEIWVTACSGPLPGHNIIPPIVETGQEHVLTDTIMQTKT